MTAREKFKIGDRVRMSPNGIACHAALGGISNTPTTGRVTGFSTRPYAVAILRDGRKTSVVVHADSWEADDTAAASSPDLDRVVRKLVTALYLYSGYTVGSRGPSGCIMDALAEVAPDVAAEIRDGIEPGDIYRRRWPES